MHWLRNNAKFRENIRPEGVGVRGAFEVAHSESFAKIALVCKATSRFGGIVDEWHAVLHERYTMGRLVHSGAVIDCVHHTHTHTHTVFTEPRELICQ